MRSACFLLLLTACFDTSYHLVAPGDERTQLIVAAAPATNWSLPGFDDHLWARSVDQHVDMTSAGMTFYARYVFAVGADVGAVEHIDLSFPGNAQFTAYINGEPMTGSGSARTLVPTKLQPGGNVLAIALPMSPAIAVSPTLSAAWGKGSSAPRITRGPWILHPSTSGATIVWETNVAAPSTAIVDGKRFDGGAATRHFAEVSGLEASRAYKYHVEIASASSPESDLITAPNPGEPIRFAVFGDNRTNGDDHRRLVAALTAEAPDLVLNTGDMVGSSDDSEWRDFFDIEYPLLVGTPIIASVGNHELDYGDADQFARLFPPLKRGYSTRVWSLDYGDLHFAVLDSNDDLEAQARWLDQDLAQAEARGLTHHFVAMHWGPYCGVDKISHGNNDEAIEHVVPVAKKHHVMAIFSGHNHVYERGIDDQLHYVVSGGGGAPLDSPGRVKQTLVTRAINSYVIVDVVGDQVHITAKDTSGAPFDDAEWTP